MPQILRRLILLAALLAQPAGAAPAPYSLDAARSRVAFEVAFGPDQITGTMPVSAADLALDFRDVSKSHVAVTLDARAAEASFPFAAQAMKGPKVLDSAHFPAITFASRKVTGTATGARIEGILTLRGTARPVALDARIYRQTGTEEGDLSHLTLKLTGTVRRSDFGATGWADMVADAVTLDILARVDRAD